LRKINKILENLKQKTNYGKVISNNFPLLIFKQTVGKNINEVTRPYKVYKQKLYVYVNSSAWLQQLNFLKKEILEKINENLNVKLKDIVFKIGNIEKEIGAVKDLPEEDSPDKNLKDLKISEELRDIKIKKAIENFIKKL